MCRLALKAAASCIARCDQMLAANLIVFEPWPNVRQTNVWRPAAKLSANPA